MNWLDKIYILLGIIDSLKGIHKAGYTHNDLHSDNILNSYVDSDSGYATYISDLGLAKRIDQNNPEGGIYGVLPYVAPEVLIGQKYTPSTDIYSLGIIMIEMSTGQRPFDGIPFDIELAINICSGLRPEFAPGTPKCYIELAKRCMDSDPRKRPDIEDIECQFEEWVEILKDSNDTSEIRKQFLDADKIAKKLSFVSPKHPDQMYTSKLIDTKKISEKFEMSQRLNSFEIPL